MPACYLNKSEPSWLDIQPYDLYFLPVLWYSWCSVQVKFYQPPIKKMVVSSARWLKVGGALGVGERNIYLFFIMPCTNESNYLILNYL
jgi:hypothetical protein